MPDEDDTYNKLRKTPGETLQNILLSMPRECKKLYEMQEVVDRLKGKNDPYP